MAGQPWDTVPPEIERAAAAAGVTQACAEGWRPEAVSEGVRWARYMLAQGHSFDYELDPAADIVWLKAWEYGEDEPTWQLIRASARPRITFAFACTEAARSHASAIVDELMRRHGYDELDAIRLVESRHQGLPWLDQAEIDPAKDDLPWCWADKLAHNPPRGHRWRRRGR